MSLLYAALGDSVAVGFRATPGREYVAQVRRHLQRANPGWRFLKAARPGATTRDLRVLVPQAVAARPVLVTVNIGGNDLRHALPDPSRVIPVSLDNLDWGLGTLRRQTRAQIFVADVYNPLPPGTPEWRWANRWIGVFNRGLARVVARQGCVYVPIGAALATAGAGVIAADRLHPTSAGHAVIAAAFLRAGVARMARFAS